MKKVLITGISGFTGQHLAARLTQAGYQVVGITHTDRSLPWRTISCDLANRDLLIQLVKEEQPDFMVHLAAISFVAHGDPRDLYLCNLLGSRNFLEAASNVAPQAVLFASSANIYGNAEAESISESQLPAPANDYAVTKLAAEYLVPLFPVLPVTVVRPFNYTGPGQDLKFLLPKIVSHFRQRAAVIELGNIDVERDFSDVRMVVDSYARLLEKPAPGQTFNICSGRGYTLRQVIDIMTEITGHQIEVRVNPAFVRANEVKRLVGNNQKLQNWIGELHSYELRDTLQWMLESGQ
jgi:nucleoside-diphosphate-sugar epimerase